MYYKKDSKKEKKKESGRLALRDSCMHVTWHSSIVTVLVMPWPKFDCNPWRHVSTVGKGAGLQSYMVHSEWLDMDDAIFVLLNRILELSLVWNLLYVVVQTFFIFSSPNFHSLSVSFTHFTLYLSYSYLRQVVRWSTWNFCLSCFKTREYIG